MTTRAIRSTFPNLDTPALDALAAAATSNTYPAGTVLCAEGHPGDTFFMLVSGEISVTRRLEGADGEMTVRSMGPGSHFGEMSLITGAVRSATVTTCVATETLEITKDAFHRQLASSPAMTQHILEALVTMIRASDEKAITQLRERNAALQLAYERLEQSQSDRVARAALEAQLEIAAAAQRSLLPDSLPTVPGLEFGACFEPAKQIGGDFYDVRLRDDGNVSLLVADVSDKGAHAAIFMAVARTLFLIEQSYRTELVQVARSIHEGLLGASSYEMFVTAFLGVLDPTSGVLRYVRCGHDEPLLVRQDGEALDLGGTGRFLGMWNEPPPTFELRQVRLGEGDVLILFSDGGTDMRNANGEAFGRDRLARLVVDHRARSASELVEVIQEAVRAHRGPVEAFDDFTLVVVRVDDAQDGST